MAKRKKWAITAPRIIYESYPDHDLLPIDPPRPSETIRQFKLHAEDAGDTLFLFLCREADDEIDGEEFIRRLSQALRDIEAVQAAFRTHARASLPESLASATEAEIIRLRLYHDWIEIHLAGPDPEGRRWGRITSSLHQTHRRNGRFNAEMDAIESLVLGHACAGIDVRDPRYLEGVCTSLDACTNNL